MSQTLCTLRGKDDFLLAILTECQLQMLKEFGHCEQITRAGVTTSQLCCREVTEISIYHALLYAPMLHQYLHNVMCSCREKMSDL